MIYLEERDRIQMASSIIGSSQLDLSNFSGRRISSMASPLGLNRFDHRLHKVSPLDEHLRELTRIYSKFVFSFKIKQMFF